MKLFRILSLVVGTAAAGLLSSTFPAHALTLANSTKVADIRTNNTINQKKVDGDKRPHEKPHGKPSHPNRGNRPHEKPHEKPHGKPSNPNRGNRPHEKPHGKPSDHGPDKH